MFGLAKDPYFAQAGRPVSIDNIKKAQELYEKLGNYRAVAKKMGKDLKTVYRWVNEYTISRGKFPVATKL